MIVFHHPNWFFLRPYVRLSSLRGNVDLLDLPDDLRALALATIVDCVACAAPIRCFRARTKSKRSRVSGSSEERRLFYASTCASTVNTGCSRSRAAKDHKRLVRTMLGEKDGCTREGVVACSTGSAGSSMKLHTGQSFCAHPDCFTVVEGAQKVCSEHDDYDEVADVVAKIDASLKFAPRDCREAMLAARALLVKES